MLSMRTWSMIHHECTMHACMLAVHPFAPCVSYVTGAGEGDFVGGGFYLTFEHRLCSATHPSPSALFSHFRPFFEEVGVKLWPKSRRLVRPKPGGLRNNPEKKVGNLPLPHKMPGKKCRNPRSTGSRRIGETEPSEVGGQLP